MLKAAWHWGSDSSVVNDPLWISIMYNYQSKHNKIYAQSIHIFHNYMFRPILGHFQVVSYSLESEVL